MRQNARPSYRGLHAILCGALRFRSRSPIEKNELNVQRSLKALSPSTRRPRRSRAWPVSRTARPTSKVTLRSMMAVVPTVLLVLARFCFSHPTKMLPRRVKEGTTTNSGQSARRSKKDSRLRFRSRDRCLKRTGANRQISNCTPCARLRFEELFCSFINDTRCHRSRTAD